MPTITRKRFSALGAQIGAECIYQESSLVKHVRMIDVRIDDDVIEWALDPINSIGFSECVDEQFDDFEFGFNDGSGPIADVFPLK